MIGLVGWPMIHATLAAEGSDSFDAVGRCYSYVIQEAWSYVWFVLVAIVYGAVVVFFVGLVGSLAVYLGKWGVASMPGAARFNRDPSYLCVYAPTSFGWRELLLSGSPVLGPRQVYNEAAVTEYVTNTFHWWNYIGAFFVSLWLQLFFLMIIGFGYSYFWSSSTIIYFLMRRKVDDIDLDEVYLEEEEDNTAAAFTPAAPAPAPAPGTVQMVDAPTLHKPAPPAATLPPESPGTNPGNSASTPPAAPPA
jgi:hypothetical protein